MPDPKPIKTLPPLTLAGVAATALDDLPPLYTKLHAHLASLPAAVLVAQTPLPALHAQLAELRARDPNRKLPLHGVPYVAKDNIDAPPHPTTNGCAATATEPVVPAAAVARLTAAGALLLAKANMDQFATGLVGTRSPAGVVPNATDPRFVAGGSSSGSATAVAAGGAAFALSTDTAGSGRVPAAMQRLVGLKPTRGLVSCAGVRPACRSLDCVGVLANSVDDAAVVLARLAAPDEHDPFSRAPPGPAWLDRLVSPSGDAAAAGRFRFGTPGGDGWPRFDGDAGAAANFAAAAADLVALGGRHVEVDYEPLARVASLLYDGPFVAERYGAVGKEIEEKQDDPEWAGAFDPVVKRIILSGRGHTAEAVFDAVVQVGLARQRVDRAIWDRVDLLVVPTVPRVVTPREVAADPVGTNSMLGWYTNFVNLLDYCALAVPARAVRDDRLRAPRGVTLIGRAFTEPMLLQIARLFEAYNG